jgi:hypothetical protein
MFRASISKVAHVGRTLDIATCKRARNTEGLKEKRSVWMIYQRSRLTYTLNTSMGGNLKSETGSEKDGRNELGEEHGDLGRIEFRRECGRKSVEDGAARARNEE